MIIKAMEIQEACKDAMMSPEVMIEASKFMQKATNGITQDEFVDLMFRYSGSLAAMVATLVSHICLTEEQINQMVSDIEEFDKITNDVLGGDK